jgi:hypothetical protein
MDPTSDEIDNLALTAAVLTTVQAIRRTHLLLCRLGIDLAGVNFGLSNMVTATAAQVGETLKELKSLEESPAVMFLAAELHPERHADGAPELLDVIYGDGE